MGDHIRSKTKLGYIIDKHITAKIFSILLVILLISTAFSSITVAQKPADSIRDKIGKIIDKIIGDGGGKTDDSSEGAVDDEPAFKTKLGDLFKELSMIRREGTPIFSVVTKYKDIETTTLLRRFLPTTIDVDNDGDKDIRVWVFRLPGIDLRPPAACIKTTLLVRRLNDDIKYGPFEIYLQYTPNIISGLAKVAPFHIRIGYQSPAGEEVPKYCIVTHKNIPHLLYPRLKTTHRIAINPGPAVGKSQLNLLFSIVNETAESELTIQVNHSPAIKNEISFSLSKDHFIRRGQTLEISRKNVVSSNVSLFIKDVMGIDSGSLTVNNLPKKITLSWLLARNGYIELNTHGSGTGKVKAAVNGVISLGFKPETGVNFHLGWETPGLRKILNKGKSFNLEIDASASATLSDLYVDVPGFDLLGLIKPQKLKLTASLLSFNLKAGVDVGKVVLKPYPGADTVAMNVENADVTLKGCNINLVTVELPIVGITYPKDGDVVSGVVTVTGAASAPVGKKIKLVQLSIDDGKEINLSVDANGDWSYSWGTLGVPNGKHTIYAISYDDSGSESDYDSVTVTVDNVGANWRPTVSIESPSNLQIVSGSVYINGTASDADGNLIKVYLNIKNILRKSIIGDDVELAVDQSGHWSYKWDTSKLTAGLYTIKVQSYDGKDYSPNVSVQIWVKIKSALDFTLTKASIDITNFVLQAEIPGIGIPKVEVSSFKASGSGYLSTGENALSVGGSGVIDIKDTSVSLTNKTGVTTKLLDNLSMNFTGEGSLELSKEKISLGLNASIYLHVDETLGIENITLGLKGKASLDIKIDELGSVTIGDEDSFDVNITNLIFKVGKIIDISANRISANGTGDISIKDKKITLSSDSIECHIDELSVNTTLGVFSISGNLGLSKYGEITAEFIDLFSFNVSYDGLTSLVITDFEFKVISSKGTAAISAKSVNIQPDGYAGISYYKDELEITCCIDIHDITMYGLLLSFNDSFYGPFDVTGDFDACFTLTSDLKIDFGSGWIRITIGGNGRADLDIHAQLRNINNYRGYLAAEMSLVSGNDSFVINISNISGNAHLDVLGSAVLSLDVFELYLENRTTEEELVNISIENFMVSFGLNASIQKSEIVLIVEEAGLSLDDGHVYISINGKFNMSLYGTIDVDMSADLSGYIKLVSNETGLQDLNVTFTGDVNIEITNLNFAYVNTVKSTNIALEVGVISINGNADIHITKDYIEAGIGVGDDTKTQGDKKGSKESQDESGILIEDFMFNATLASLDFNVLVEFDVLDIVSGVRINIKDGITISTSADLTAENIYFIVESDSNAISIDIDIDSFSIAGNGGGTITINENLSLISGSSINTNFVLKNASLDVRIDAIYLWLMLEDADVSFVGSNVTFNIDFSKGIENLTMVADLSGNSHITVNTLWAYLSTTSIEIRVKNLLISGPTTINIDADLSRNVIVTVKINAVEGIKADEFSIISGAPLINLYGVDGGPNVSVGVDKTFNILIGLDGLWHFDMLLFMGGLFLLTNVDFDGKIDPLLLGLASSYYIEADVDEASTVSFNIPNVKFLSERKLVFELEPGIIALDLEGLDVIFGLMGGELNPGIIGVFGYADSPVTIKLLTLTGETFPIIQDALGHIEVTIDINSLSTTMSGDERDIDLALDFKGNWDRAKLLGIADINGSGNAHIEFQASGSIGNNLYIHLGLNWAGTRYVTFPQIIRWAHTGAGQRDFSIGVNPDSGDFIVETDQIEVVMNQNTQYITILDLEGNVLLQGTMQIYENGEIVIENTRGNTIIGPAQNEDLIINEINIAEQLNIIFDGGFHLWVWFNENWVKFFGIGEPDPVVEGAVTLLLRKASGSIKNELHVNSWEILPGDDLNFSAWYKPGPNNHGPYAFTFNYGDNSSSETVDVGTSQVPIKIYPPSNHKYTTIGQHVATVTVIDYGNSGDTATDTFNVEVIEKYLRVSPDNGKTQWSGSGTISWNFEKISGELEADGKLHGTFNVMNVANELYSNYTIEWNLTGYDNDTMKYGTEWIFDSKNGSLGPGENQTVNFSFKPPLTPGDYDVSPNVWNVSVNNVNDPGESVLVDFDIYYGLVELLPDTYQIVYVEKGSSVTYDDLFWVFSKRWEKLDWIISDVTFNEGFDPSLISYSFNPNQGTIHPGNPPTPISLYIDASNEEFTGCTMTVKVQRQGNDINSTADNDTITISIRVIDFDFDPDPDWITPDGQSYNWWFFPNRARDNKLNKGAYYNRNHGDWTSDSLILTLDNPISCRGFRINAKAQDNLSKMEVKLYTGTNPTPQFTITFDDGEWVNHDWTEYDFGTVKDVDRAEIKFQLETGCKFGGLHPHWAVVWEFDFKEDI